MNKWISERAIQGSVWAENRASAKTLILYDLSTLLLRANGPSRLNSNQDVVEITAPSLEDAHASC